MNVDVGKIIFEVPGVHPTDAREAISKHLQGNWGDATPNEKFNNGQNVWRRKDAVISRHVDRNGVKFVIMTEFACRATTVKLQ